MRRTTRDRRVFVGTENLESRTVLSSLIALIDTGVNSDSTNSPYLDMAAAINEVDGTNNVTDTYGHGTQVSDNIAQQIANTRTFAGGGAQAQIVPIKDWDPTLNNGSGGLSADAIINGIYDAVAMHASVINLSFAGPSDFAGTTKHFGVSLSSAIEYAASNNVIVVAAAGNNGDVLPVNGNNVQYGNQDIDIEQPYPVYPAVIKFDDNVASMIVVATLNSSTGGLTSDSNYGVNHVTLAAPGGETSFAAGQVSGIAGELAALRPDQSALQITNRIEQTVQVTTGLNSPKVVSTGGYISPANAVNGFVNPPSSGPQYLDDSQVGHGFTDSPAGAWTEYTNYSQGVDNTATTATGGGALATATWAFTNLAPGTYEVWTTWEQSPNRPTNAPYTIFNGTTPLTTVRVNQQLGAGQLYDSVAGWTSLGEAFSITSGTLAVQLSTSGIASGAVVVADAVRINLVNPQYRDDSQVGNGFTDSPAGAWTEYTNYSQGVDNTATTATGSSTLDAADWTFTNLAPGVYDVWATWEQSPNRATNAPYTVFDGTTPLTTVRVNQQLGAGQLYDSVAGWTSLGEAFQIKSGTLKVQLDTSGIASGAVVVADAIRIDPEGSLPAGSQSSVKIHTATIQSNGSNAQSAEIPATDEAMSTNPTSPSTTPVVLPAGPISVGKAFPIVGGFNSTRRSVIFFTYPPNGSLTDTNRLWLNPSRKSFAVGS